MVGGTSYLVEVDTLLSGVNQCLSWRSELKRNIPKNEYTQRRQGVNRMLDSMTWLLASSIACRTLDNNPKVA